MADTAHSVAIRINEACRGLGTDDALLISTLCPLANSEACEVAADYKAQFGRDLRDVLKSELSGKYEDLMCGLVQPKVCFFTPALSCPPLTSPRRTTSPSACTRQWPVPAPMR
jgi:hypothetical protein